MDKLIEILNNYVEADEITATSEFRKDLGLASFDTVCVINEIKATLGIECTPADFVRYSTVGEFSNNIIENK